MGNMGNVVVPMAGDSSRFTTAGYDKPKFLLDIDGMPMIQRAVTTVGIGARYIYIVKAEDNKKYNLSEILPTFTPNLESIVLEVYETTDGPAASVLMAKDYIDNEDFLIVCNSDQMLEWVPNNFLRDAGENKNLDGSIATFTAEGTRWSYAKTDKEGLVIEVAEKKQISDQATAGVYYWRKGSDFVNYAEQMIEKDIRVNGEFYVAPVYNEAILEGKTVGIYPVDKMISLGTPEDLKLYLDSLSGSE
jgi:dTDP-glucose pyrophosphorylase